MKNKPNFFFDNRGFPNWGEGGGPPLGNFSHIIPFFSDNVLDDVMEWLTVYQYYMLCSSIVVLTS